MIAQMWRAAGEVQAKSAEETGALGS